MMKWDVKKIVLCLFSSFFIFSHGMGVCGVCNTIRKICCCFACCIKQCPCCGDKIKKNKVSAFPGFDNIHPDNVRFVGQLGPGNGTPVDATDVGDPEDLRDEFYVNDDKSSGSDSSQ